MVGLLRQLQNVLDFTRGLDFLAPLGFRIFLAFPFWMAGTQKLATASARESTAMWFDSMGFPAPEVMVWLAGLTEAGGAILLVVGLAVRWITLPLMFTMLVAIFAVHWDNGWAAIASSADDPGVGSRLSKAKEILRENGNYQWLTGKGSFVILNNGIEFGVTYFLMCLSLFFTGAGRFFSVDYWIRRSFMNKA